MSSETRKREGKTQRIVYQDALSSSAETLIPELGTDVRDKSSGKVDVRRFSNIDRKERMWLTWFKMLPEDEGGAYMKPFCEEYLNISMSVSGMRSKQIIALFGALSGKGIRKKTNDTRNFIQRHITQRNKEPETEYEALEDE